MSAIPSNIRVFVKFKEDTVFAGENIECTITFRNLEPPKLQPRPSLARTDSLARPPDPLDHLKAARGPARPTPSPTQASSNSKTENVSGIAQTHRHTASLNVVDAAWKQQQSPVSPEGGFNLADSNNKHKHEKRISIVSLDSDGGTQKMRTMASAATPQRPGFKHGRSASLQHPPSSYRSIRPPSLGGSRSIGQRSPLVDSATSPGFDTPESPFGSRRISEVNTPAAGQPSPVRKSRNPTGPQNTFKFPTPSAQQPPEILVESQKTNNTNTKQSTPLPIRSHSPRAALNGKLAATSELVASAGRVFSVQSMDGTPRSSLEIYSNSNHSDETLASELPSQPTNRLLQRPFFGRTLSQHTRLSQHQPETLMMGYVQIHGSFTLDGSLVSLAPFEEVKRKAVVGGQAGGGVVGITEPAEEGGLFGSFSWGSIGQSIGGLLGGGEMSSIKEMKGIADSRSVPLISTAKSILFVDLRLAPGQSKSYNYKFKLPRGLPPTHKGRAMKVTYNLVIGTQRPSKSSKSQQQQIKQVDVPFRVFCSINSQGEPLGHDLMSPYIILKDQAHVLALDPEATTLKLLTNTTSSGRQSSTTTPEASASADDFQQYVEVLLTKPRRNSSFGLLSPTAEPESPDSSRQVHRVTSAESSYSAAAFERATPSPRVLIEQAIRASMHPTSPNHTPTSFTIARSSVPIATLTLSRPALKLGDNFIISIDFTDAQLPSYAIEATLESAEKVDPALAIRSVQSVERATRRIWARTVENCQWAKRTTLNWQIPANATPGFVTTGVGLEWCVRLEIVVALQSAMDYSYGEDSSAEDEDEDVSEEDSNGGANPSHRLAATPKTKATRSKSTREMTRLEDAPRKAERMLEVLAEDERGTTLAAVPRLACESFEVTIPIRVFGAVVGNSSNSTAKDNESSVEEEGLVI